MYLLVYSIPYIVTICNIILTFKCLTGPKCDRQNTLRLIINFRIILHLLKHQVRNKHNIAAINVI